LELRYSFLQASLSVSSGAINCTGNVCNLYVAPPFIAAYAIMNWAVERYASPLPADMKAYITHVSGTIDCPRADA
jgi:hypothetical protein